MDAEQIRRLKPMLTRYLRRFDDCFARKDKHGLPGKPYHLVLASVSYLFLARVHQKLRGKISRVDRPARNRIIKI